MNEIGKSGKSGIQGIGGDLGSVTKTESTAAIGVALNAGLGTSLEKTITDTFNTKIANFDSASSSLAPLAKIETPELVNAGKPFNAVPAQLLPNKPAVGLFTTK